MASPIRKQNRAFIAALGAVVLGLLVLLILLQSSNLWKSFRIETASDTLLLYGLSSLNVAAFIIFGFIFLRSVVKLVRERRALALGSKLKSRLFFYFALVSILPIVAMAVFSYLFMNRALDRWFTQIPENVVREAEKIQDRSNADQFERLQSTANVLAVTLTSTEIDKGRLDSLASTGGLAFIEVIGRDGSLIVAGGEDLSGLPELTAIRSGNVGDESLRDGSGIDVAIAAMPDGSRIALGVDFRKRESVNQLFNNALVELDRLKDEQFTVRQIGFLTLGVLTFLLIFASSWTAFHIARGLTVPIKALAEGAEGIAQGDVGRKVEVLAEDELGLLVETFNQMSAKLEANQTELTERRRYIETVLLSLPTGVISLDPGGKITTMNPAAKGILRLEPGDLVGVELSSIIDDSDREPIDRLIGRAKRIGHASDQTKFSLNGNGIEPMPVAITVTALPEDRGVVIVMEDLSELIAAQRASAWQEVARRMAHEIKNPLTPIQLSAERIAKRFSGQWSVVGGQAAAGSFVSESTETILREVQSLKAMVDEFSRFARLPNARLELWDVNEVIRQTAALYEDREEVGVDVSLAEDLPPAMIDDEQLKRVFVNLIDNAIEAPGDEDLTRVSITSRLETVRDLIVIEVGDNGRGIDPADYPKLFQPYFSTKGRGTGLGLAIVHRIITEHHGKIKAVPNQPKGAKFIVELPITGI